MKNYLSILIAVLLMVSVSCQQTNESNQSSEEYQAEVRELITQQNKLYFEAWENKDLDSTLFFLDEGFINMFGFGLSQTKKECREAWKEISDTYLIESVEYKSVELLIDQNYAFETGLFKQKWITNDKQDTISFDMRGLTVYKKQEDGSWKMFRLMGQQ